MFQINQYLDLSDDEIYTYMSEYFYDEGANEINDDERNVYLHEASEEGNLELVKYLLKREGLISYINSKNNYG